MDVNVWKYYTPHLEEGNHFFGLRSEYFYHPLSGRAMTFQYPFDKLLGGGRFISRKAIEACFPLWAEGLNNGLDKNCDERLAAKGYNPTFIETQTPMILDIKTRTNIWSYNAYGAFSVPTKKEKALAFFTEEEKEFLKQIGPDGQLANQLIS